ncbi:uncharacterized protein LOC142229522 [Haematobia irritans]|uniref:uncharacterized protein LOC142229522 n=1 Tax=Haematobia irritans TaxID=7368 RepID=UPI003F4FAE93
MEQLGELEACRICVCVYPVKDMDFIHIFHKNEEFQNELDFIRGEIEHWKLKIEQGDALPQRICADCFAKFASIEAFRKECELTQENLLQTFINADNKTDISPMLSQAETEPLLGTGSDQQQDLVPLEPQNDVVLNDFRVFNQQFDQFDDNPALVDSSATLLDNNLMTTDAANEMGFLPSQNLFTFETAEPPSAGTLPLDETENPSIMGDIMNVKPEADNREEQMGKHDLEDMLRRSIILTNNTTSITTTKREDTEMTVTRTTTTPAIVASATIIKTEAGTTFHTGEPCDKPASDVHQQVPIHREDNASDNECDDDAQVNNRLKGLPYTCHYCFCPDVGPIDHLSFPDEDALSQHFFDVHDPNRPYTCPKCDNSYKTQRLRDNHIRLTHESGRKCNFCNKTLRSTVEIHQFHCQHIGDWECAICKEKFPQTPLFRFRLHGRVHERSKNFKCRICERTFTRKANFEAHERMHSNEAKSQWHCEICKTNFLTNYDLRRHNYQHHNDESPVKCKECNQGFSSIAFLQRHITQIHNSISTNVSTTSSKVHICLKCNATFTSLLALQRHMAITNSNNGQCVAVENAKFDQKERRRIQRQGVFPCFLCPKRFHLRSQLDKHLNTHDARLRPYQCEQCYVRCRTSIELKQHVDVAHLNIKAFSCEKCGKSFGYKKDLRDHMLFHAEVNVHCNEEGCDYVCKNEKALNDHIRHKHRLLSCEYCREKFTRQKMTAHLRNVHRAEIDVDLAESDNFYKYKLLNNNNDITQISFNLLNTQSTENNATNQTFESLSSLPDAASTYSSACSSSSISSSTSPPMSSNSNNLALNGFIATTSTSPSSQNELNLVNDGTTNVSASNTMYVVSSSAETSNLNENNVDQYFMASLMDTDQEVTVT